MAGITFVVAIRATPRTPQRIFRMEFSLIAFSTQYLAPAQLVWLMAECR
jgi:hypothetical protein